VLAGGKIDISCEELAQLNNFAFLGKIAALWHSTGQN